MKFKKNQILILFNLSFIIGIGLASFLLESLSVYHFYFFIASLFLLILLFIFYHNKKVFFVVLFLFFIILGAWRYLINIPQNSFEHISFYNNKSVALSGLVSDDPEIKNNLQRLTISNLSIDNESNKITGRILVSTNLYPHYHYGDKLKLICDLKPVENFNDFSYDRYLARYHIYSLCYYPKINLLQSNQGNFILEEIFKIKNKIKAKIDIGLHADEASLAKAMLLGNKSAINQNIKNNFSRTGLSHIIAISGLHISIIAAMIIYALLGLGLNRKKSFYVTCLILFFYLLILGFPASAVRASIMVFFMLLALSLGRLNKLFNSLVFAASLMLLANPRLLRDDIGFQLSFLAVLGIGIFYPIISEYFYRFKFTQKNKIIKLIFDIIAVSLAAQILTLPIIAYNFSMVSLIAPISNLFVVWLLPLVIISLFITVFLSFIMPGFIALFFLPTSLLLKYIIFVSNFFAFLPYTSIEVYYLGWYWVLLYYFVIIYIALLYRKKYKE